MRAEITEVPTRFVDASGELVEIDPSLVPAPETGAMETAATSVTVTFDAQEAAEAPVTLSGPGYKVGLDMMGVVENARLTFDDATRYLNVARDTDLEYQATRTGVKETVVLKSAAAPSSYHFSLDLDGLDVRRDPFGGYGLWQSGDSAPTMNLGELLIFDSSENSGGDPAVCPDATMTVNAAGDGDATVTYEIDPAWLADPARVFPIMVDPTITITGAADTADAYISKNYPNSSYGSSTELRVGRYNSGGTDTGYNRSLVKFYWTTADIPAGSYIHGADLKLYLFHQYYDDSAPGQHTTALRYGEIAGSWNGSTWNSFPGYTYIGTKNVSGERGQWVALDCAATAQGWVNDYSTNYGIMAYQYENGTQDTTHWKKFYSSDYSNSSYLPKFVVTYSNPGISGSSVQKSVYRLGDTVVATVRVNTTIPGAINCIKALVNWEADDDTVATRRGTFQWTETEPTSGWSGTTACPGVGGGFVSYYPASVGSDKVELLETQCHENIVDTNDWAEVVFKWKILDGYGDIQNNDVDIQVMMDPVDGNNAGNRWTSAIKKIDSDFDVAPAKVTSLSVDATAGAWFKESVDASGTLLDDDDYPNQGRGSLVATWAPTTGALGYKVLLSDGNSEREIGRTFGSQATTFTTGGLGLYPKDTTIKSFGSLPAARSPFGASPLDATAREASVPSTQTGTGVIVTDGTYLYVHKKDTFRPGPAAWTRLASGLTTAQPGVFLGQVGASSGRTMMSAFYLDGFIYEGFAVTPSTLQGIWKGAAGTDASRQTMNFTRPLLMRHSPVDVTSATQDVMVTAGARGIYSISHDRSQPSATFKIREYSVPTSQTTATFVADRNVTVSNVPAFAWLDGAFVADDNLYLIEGAGSNRIIRVDMRTWTATGMWTIDGGSSLSLAAACFEPVSRTVFAGALDKGTMYRYTGPGFDLRDNPKKLYASTPETATDANSGYQLRVVPFNSAESDPATSTNASTWKTLDQRTVTVNQDPRHTVYDLGGVAGGAASARLEGGARQLALDATDLSVASWGPEAELTRYYRSKDTTAALLTPGWHFGFEQHLQIASVDSTRAVYVDEDGEGHVFKKQNGIWFAPNGYVADLGFEPHAPLITSDDQWTLIFKDHSVLAFDGDGRLQSETDSNGQRVLYSFNDAAVQITAANGAFIKVTLEDGKATKAEYVAGAGQHRRVDYDTTGGALRVDYFPDVIEDSYSIAYGYTAGSISSAEIVNQTYAGTVPRWEFTYGADGSLRTASSPQLAEGQASPVTNFEYGYEAASESDVATITRSAVVSGAPTAVVQRFASNPTGTMAYMTNERTAVEHEARWTYAYSPANEVVEERSPTGKSVSRVFDSRSNVLFDYDEERHLNAYEYYADDRLFKHVDPRGCTTYSGYDAATGNLLWSDRVLNEEAEHATTRNEYDARGLLTTQRTRISGDRWVTTRYSDFAGTGQAQRTEVRAQVSAGTTYTDEPISLGATATVASIVTTSSVDEFGQVLSQTDAGGLVTMKDAVYSPAGKLKRSTDVDGVVTHYAYDALGNLKETSQTVDATSGPAFAEWHRYEVDAYGRNVRESDLGVGGLESTWVKHVFDPSGNEVQTVDSLEGTTTTWYDARGNTLAQWAPDVDQSDPQSASRWVFDADGVELAEIEAGKPASDAIRKEWRADGLLLKVVDADGSWMRYEYDDGGNQTAEISPTEDGQESAERTYYDVGGRVIGQESSDGMVTNTSYDLAGRPLRVYTTNTVDTGEEDEDGEPIYATVETTASAMSYNELGWTLASTDSDGVSKRSVYDVLGNSTEESVWASGAPSPTSVTSFDYDDKKRVIRQAVTEAGKENIVEYSYDAFGRVIAEVHSKNGVVSRDIATDYDEFGRETRVEDHKTGVISRYAYAGGGKKHSTSNLTYGSTTVTSTVDAIGRETTQAATIALPGRTVSVEREVSWDLTKNLPQSATVRIGGVTKTMTAEFDDTDRLINVTGGLWGTGGLDLTYDRGGSGAELTDSVSLPWGSGYVTTSRTFGLTPSGRISTVTVGSREIDYSWDPAGTGELVRVKDGATTTTFGSKDGHVATATTGSSVTTFDYDAAGRRTRERAGSTVEDYTWVGDDSLTFWKRTVSGSTAASATYGYDGDGQRMRADVHGTSPWSSTATDTAYTYGWDGLVLRWVSGQSAGATSTIEYLNSADGRAYAGSYSATRDAEATSAMFQILANDHGDIVALADEDGDVFAAYAYGPFGEYEGVATTQTARLSAALAHEIANAQPLRYAGYCYDTWSGSYYLQARYYDADTKQFITRDPADADGEEGAYQYCTGSPLQLIDSDGREPHGYNSADGYGSSGYSHGYNHKTHTSMSSAKRYARALVAQRRARTLWARLRARAVALREAAHERHIRQQRKRARERALKIAREKTRKSQTRALDSKKKQGAPPRALAVASSPVVQILGTAAGVLKNTALSSLSLGAEVAVLLDYNEKAKPVLDNKNSRLIEATRKAIEGREPFLGFLQEGFLQSERYPSLGELQDRKAYPFSTCVSAMAASPGYGSYEATHHVVDPYKE